MNQHRDQSARPIEYAPYAEFADAAALAAYKAHPTYAETTARVRPMRELRLSADVVAG
ncbi:Dabb family protein [Mesorhizobium marinum]|uniref:Dabb family protein n=1 Tax=Mesorhizobium marinum TaxID=3228790 RepID=UPI003F5BACDD